MKMSASCYCISVSAKKGKQSLLFIIRLLLLSNTALITASMALLISCLSTKYWSCSSDQIRKKLQFAWVRLHQSWKSSILVRSSSRRNHGICSWMSCFAPFCLFKVRLITNGFAFPCWRFRFLDFVPFHMAGKPLSNYFWKKLFCFTSFKWTFSAMKKNIKIKRANSGDPIWLLFASNLSHLYNRPQEAIILTSVPLPPWKKQLKTTAKERKKTPKHNRNDW